MILLSILILIIASWFCFEAYWLKQQKKRIKELELSKKREKQFEFLAKTMASFLVLLVIRNYFKRGKNGK